jgi:hypothetical protein
MATVAAVVAAPLIPPRRALIPVVLERWLVMCTFLAGFPSRRDRDRT